MAKILHVEDNDTFAKIIKGELEFEGHMVISAPTAEQAHSILASQPFDIIVSDHDLGKGMKGAQLAHTLHAEGLRTPFVLLTSEPWEGAIRDTSLTQSTPELGKPISGYIDKGDKESIGKLLDLIIRFTERDKRESRVLG